MVNLNLEMDEGILLETKNVLRYDQSYNEDEIAELYLTNKAILCATEYNIIRIPLSSIRVVNGNPQVRFHADDDYDDGMTILYINGTMHHFVFERASDINIWINAISNAVLNPGIIQQNNGSTVDVNTAVPAAQVVYVQQPNQNVAIRNKRQLKNQLEYDRIKKEEAEKERLEAIEREKDELRRKEAEAKRQAQLEEKRRRIENGDYTFKEKFSLAIVGSVILTLGLILTIITEGAGFFIFILILGALLGGFGVLRALLLIRKSNKIKSKISAEKAEVEAKREAHRQRKSAQTIICPHCGAPTHLGKTCEYCGGALN